MGQEIVQLFIITAEHSFGALPCLLCAQSWLSEDVQKSRRPLLFVVSLVPGRIDGEELNILPNGSHANTILILLRSKLRLREIKYLVQLQSWQVSGLLYSLRT